MYICLGLPEHPECVGSIDDFCAHFKVKGYDIYKPTKYSKVNGKKRAEIFLTDGDLSFNVTLLETVNISEVKDG